MVSKETAALLVEYQLAHAEFSNFGEQFWHNLGKPDQEFRVIGPEDFKELRRLKEEADSKKEDWWTAVEREASQR